MTKASYSDCSYFGEGEVDTTILLGATVAYDAASIIEYQIMLTSQKLPLTL